MLSVVNQRMENFDARAKADMEAAILAMSDSNMADSDTNFGVTREEPGIRRSEGLELAGSDTNMAISSSDNALKILIASESNGVLDVNDIRYIIANESCMLSKLHFLF